MPCRRRERGHANSVTRNTVLLPARGKEEGEGLLGRGAGEGRLAQGGGQPCRGWLRTMGECS